MLQNQKISTNESGDLRSSLPPFIPSRSDSCLKRHPRALRDVQQNFKREMRLVERDFGAEFSVTSVVSVLFILVWVLAIPFKKGALAKQLSSENGCCAKLYLGSYFTFHRWHHIIRK